MSNKLRHMYRFPLISVKSGQYVALYTKKTSSYNLGTYGPAPCRILYRGEGKYKHFQSRW